MAQDDPNTIITTIAKQLTYDITIDPNDTCICFDTSNQRIGINTIQPSTELDIRNGSANIGLNITCGNNITCGGITTSNQIHCNSILTVSGQSFMTDNIRITNPKIYSVLNNDDVVVKRDLDLIRSNLVYYENVNLTNDLSQDSPFSIVSDNSNQLSYLPTAKVDDTSLTIGNHILVNYKKPTDWNQKYNGVYTVIDVSFIERRLDLRYGTDICNSIFVYVSDGSANRNSGWALELSGSQQSISGHPGVVIGENPIQFHKISSFGSNNDFAHKRLNYNIFTNKNTFEQEVKFPANSIIDNTGLFLTKDLTFNWNQNRDILNPPYSYNVIHKITTDEIDNVYYPIYTITCSGYTQSFQDSYINTRTGYPSFRIDNFRQILFKSYWYGDAIDGEWSEDNQNVGIIFDGNTLFKNPVKISDKLLVDNSLTVTGTIQTNHYPVDLSDVATKKYVDDKISNRSDVFTNLTVTNKLTTNGLDVCGENIYFHNMQPFRSHSLILGDRGKDDKHWSNINNGGGPSARGIVKEGFIDYDYQGWDGGVAEDDRDRGIAWLDGPRAGKPKFFDYYALGDRGLIGGGTNARFTFMMVCVDSVATGIIGKVVRYFYPSDKSLKIHIDPLNRKLDLVKKMNPVSFLWKDSLSYDYGFIAQELNVLAPHLIEDDKDESGNIIKKYTNEANIHLIAILTKAIQDLDEDKNKEISELEKRINSLEEENNKLKTDIKSILSRLTQLENSN